MKAFTKYILIKILLFNVLFVSSQNNNTLFISGKIQNINNNILEIKNVKPLIGSYSFTKIEVNITDSVMAKITARNKDQYLNKNILIYVKQKNEKFFLCKYKDYSKFQESYLTPTNEPLVILDIAFIKDKKYHDFKKINYELNEIVKVLKYNLDDKLAVLSSIVYGPYRPGGEDYYCDFIREYAIWEYYKTAINHYCYSELLYGSFYTLRNSNIPLKYTYIIDKLLSPPFDYKAKETISLYLKFIDSEEEYLIEYGEKKLQETLVFFQEDIKINKQILENLKDI